MLVAVVCAVLFTVLLGNNFIEEAPVAVIDLDNSKYSHELIQEMDASPYIDINTVFHSAVNPKALFYRDRFAAVVYFPKDLEKNRYSDVAGRSASFMIIPASPRMRTSWKPQYHRSRSEQQAQCA